MDWLIARGTLCDFIVSTLPPTSAVHPSSAVLMRPTAKDTAILRRMRPSTKVAILGVNGMNSESYRARTPKMILPSEDECALEPRSTLSTLAAAVDDSGSRRSRTDDAKEACQSVAQSANARPMPLMAGRICVIILNPAIIQMSVTGLVNR